jgi:CRISPR-associated protein Csb2
MQTLNIGWHYLTGYAVATDPASRERVEWPPHPARVFMALAAAWFETRPPADDSAWNAEGEALNWLESLGDPEIVLPPVEPSATRSFFTVHVPVNDSTGPAKATLQSCPALSRSKQPRTFPKTWVGDSPVILRWLGADDADRHREALGRLCRKVTRIGHTSSLVAMRVFDEAELSPDNAVQLVRSDGLAEHQLRPLTAGMLDMLTERFGEADRRRARELDHAIVEFQQERKSSKGKAARGRQAELDHAIEVKKAERRQLVPRMPTRPSVALWRGYRARGAEGKPEAARTLFDHDMLILTQVSGPTLPLVASLSVAQAMRNVILSRGPQPPPDWASGHTRGGQPLQNDDGHLAIVPLPAVGHAHADGHLLGVGLVFPRSVAYPERGRVLGPVLLRQDGQPESVELKLGSLGVWTVRKRDWQDNRRTLSTPTWTAFDDRRQGAEDWASVTPVVLDRFPKANRLHPDERPDWEAEVETIIRAACTRIGLPEPILVDFGTTCWHLGSSRALGKRRPLRGHPGFAHAALGDGFPPFPSRGTNAPRPQVHVWLRFPRPVIGPILLGAGRYFGYGLCKPLGEPRS